MIIARHYSSTNAKLSNTYTTSSRLQTRLLTQHQRWHYLPYFGVKILLPLHVAVLQMADDETKWEFTKWHTNTQRLKLEAFPPPPEHKRRDHVAPVVSVLDWLIGGRRLKSLAGVNSTLNYSTKRGLHQLWGKSTVVVADGLAPPYEQRISTARSGLICLCGVTLWAAR